MKLCSKKICTGCSACGNACPKSAISMKEDNLGEWHPVINKDLCVDCGLCKKVCPVESEVKKFDVGICYAAWSKNKEILKSAASAGIVTSIAYKVIEDGGVVVGTKWVNEKLIFDFALTKDELKHFQGSKYVQAYVGDTYKKIKNYLQNNKQVLFTGTPCQVAGLKTYLGKEYENLITIDLICHGVSNGKLLIEYLNTNTKVKKFTNILFRGPEGLRMTVYDSNKIVYEKPKLIDLFYMAYVKGLIHRENCYTCSYAGVKRVGDITAGDFWGLDKSTLKESANKIPYVSLVFTNNHKGQTVLEKCGDIIYYEKHDIEEAIPGNGQLKAPCRRSEERDEFVKNYEKMGFIRAVKQTQAGKSVKKQYFKYSMIEIVHKIKNKK